MSRTVTLCGRLLSMTSVRSQLQVDQTFTGYNGTLRALDNVELIKPLLRGHRLCATGPADESAVYEQLQDEARKRSGRRCSSRAVNVVAALAALLVLLALLFPAFPTKHADLHEFGSIVQIGPYWHNFSHIDTWFPFGDSYTDMIFYEYGIQPTVENPLGNPPLPDLAPRSGFGVTYVAYLAARYNHSVIKTYNMGRGGGTLDDEINPSFILGGDLITNIGRFHENYCTNETGSWQSLAWKPERTLFSVFYGINDILTHNRTHPRFEDSFLSYASSLRRLYATGARNFVLFNLPPVYRTPAVLEGSTVIRAEKAAVLDFNDHIARLIERTKIEYPDMTIFSVDAHSLVNEIVHNADRFGPTRVYKRTSGRCVEYDNVYRAEDAITRGQVARCGGHIPVHYLWHDLIHLTWPAHEVFAQVMEVVLKSVSASRNMSAEAV